MREALLFYLTLSIFSGYSQDKPAVWIYTDMSDKSLPGANHMGTINDPDDISAMAGYLLMANEFDTKGIVIASTHRKAHLSTGNQEEWGNSYFKRVYEKEVVNLNRELGGYPETIHFQQSSIKDTRERFDPVKDYVDLNEYPTVKSLFDLLVSGKDTIHVLCWGSLTEPAILVRHCSKTGNDKLLARLKFIAHWTNSPLHQGTPEKPEHVANCREDSKACAYMKEQALAGSIKYYECGAIGQHGMVSGGPKGSRYFDQFKVSGLGKIFAEGKFVYDGVDHSDAATYWTLLGTFGVSLSDISSDGTNSAKVEKHNEKKFKDWSKRIHDELLKRAIIAGLEG